LPYQIVTVAALIDTGAERTCIAPSVAADARIQPIGKTPMRSATHVIDAHVYLVDLWIHLKTIVPMSGLTITEFAEPPHDSRFHAVLGRDVLSRGSLSMVNGRYKLCLRQR
jgi:predicted aspartyl protease